MKKIIAFADTEDLSEYYDELLAQGAKHIAPRIYGHGSDLRRAELKTPDGHMFELVFINVHLGDLLLSNREAGAVDVSRIVLELENVKENLLKRVHAIQAKHKKQMEKV